MTYEEAKKKYIEYKEVEKLDKVREKLKEFKQETVKLNLQQQDI